MSYLNYAFFDEFKALDNLCRDIYGESADHKLGVTLYLEDMDRQSYLGAVQVAGWTTDYNRLKSARNIRNDLAHSRSSIMVDICTQEDVEFVRSFRTRILNQTDPIATLNQKRPKPSPVSTPRRRPTPGHEDTSARENPVGCFGIVASFFLVLACAVAFL